MAHVDWLTQLHQQLVVLNRTTNRNREYTQLRSIIRACILDKRDSRIIASLWRKLYLLDNTP
jgi:uncharacterized protein with von Willebrand factor type A (vWA) domain